MPHNNQRQTSCYTKFGNTTPCGLVLEFNDQKQSNTYIRLHRKKCVLCAGAEYSKTPSELKLIK